jgi:general secretion pathway protein E
VSRAARFIVLHSDFIEHLARRGVLRDPQVFENGKGARRSGMNGEVDWASLTKLAAPAFADELAAFYACRRIQRTDLVGDRFAGGDLSPRFLKEGRLFPFKDPQGQLTLAIAAPVDAEMLQAVETALGKKLALAVATGDDLEAALT